MQIFRKFMVVGSVGAATFGCQMASKQTEGGSEVLADYRNVPIGSYEGRSFDIRSDCRRGETFLKFMKNKIFPMIKEQAGKQQEGKLAGVKAGDGVEVRFSDDVTTYHVAFPLSRQGGRSFGAVGDNPKRMAYVADASYLFYFDELEKAYSANPSQLKNFYDSILGVLINCDASSFSKLDRNFKEVAADFMAVFIAEQYRNLVENGGRSKTSDWDNAHLQTTLLAAFHAGQTDDRGMYFEGKFTTDTYDFKDCLYKKDKGSKKPRPMKLRDYTQQNKECKRSGVNMTRRDWSLLTNELGDSLGSSREASAVKSAFGSRDNDGIKAIANFITNDRNDGSVSGGDRMVDAAVDYLMLVQRNAQGITNKLLGERTSRWRSEDFGSDDDQ